MFSWKTIEICFAKVHTQKYVWLVMGKDQIDLKKWQLAPIVRLGTKTWSPWNMMMWSRCTGMIGNWASPALYHSVLRSWTGNIFPYKVEIHHFCIGNLEMWSPSKFAKGQFQPPMFDNLKPDFPGCDSFQFITKTSKGTRHDDVQIQIDIKQRA